MKHRVNRDGLFTYPPIVTHPSSSLTLNSNSTAESLAPSTVRRSRPLDCSSLVQRPNCYATEVPC